MLGTKVADKVLFDSVISKNLKTFVYEILTKHKYICESMIE